MSESQEAEVEVFKDIHLWELLEAVQLMITIDFLYCNERQSNHQHLTISDKGCIIPKVLSSYPNPLWV